MYINYKHATINTKYITYVSAPTKSTKNGNMYVSFVHFTDGDYAMLTEKEYKDLLNKLSAKEND